MPAGQAVQTLCGRFYDLDGGLQGGAVVGIELLTFALHPQFPHPLRDIRGSLRTAGAARQAVGEPLCYGPHRLHQALPVDLPPQLLQ